MTIATPHGPARIDSRYSAEQNARVAASRWSLWIVVSPSGEFCTVKPRDAARLESAGYRIL